MQFRVTVPQESHTMLGAGCQRPPPIIRPMSIIRPVSVVRPMPVINPMPVHIWMPYASGTR